MLFIITLFLIGELCNETMAHWIKRFDFVRSADGCGCYLLLPGVLCFLFVSSV